LAALFAVYALYASGATLAPVTAALHGAGACVLGLLIVNLVQVGRRALRSAVDAVLAAITAAAILLAHLPLPLVVVLIGAVGIWLNRPRTRTVAEAAEGGQQ
jgi:chromate transport protein ChrA